MALSANVSIFNVFAYLSFQEMEMKNLEKHVSFETENSRKAYYREFKKVCVLLWQLRGLFDL